MENVVIIERRTLLNSKKYNVFYVDDEIMDNKLSEEIDIFYRALKHAKKNAIYSNFCKEFIAKGKETWELKVREFMTLYSIMIATY